MSSITGPVRIGISSCLLGQPVRFDGGHKRDRFLTDIMGPFVEWVPVCPEVEAGFGTPRETMRLERLGDGVRLLTTKTRRDLTDTLDTFSRGRVEELAGERLSGYVLKKNSPSCGLTRVKVYEGTGSPATTGRGLFAARLVERYPSLPVEEEGRLADARLRENFIERVFAYERLRSLFRPRWTIGDLVRFHTAHKLVVMAHSPDAYRQLGRLVARAKTVERDSLRERYTRDLMDALTIVATPGRHANVLRHMAGHLKRVLSGDAKAELAETIAEYQRGLVPLVVPITLIRHHVRQHAIDYLSGQVYLEPHPRELMLRNHV